MPIEVFGAGYGRTGTKSLQMALEILGYKCHHMSEAIEKPNWDFWDQAYDQAYDVTKSGSEPVDFETVFSSYTATTDFPSCAVWKDIIKQYPNAKIILTERSNADVWYESAKETIYHLTAKVDPIKLPPIFQRQVIWARKYIWDGIFEGKFEEDPELAKRKYLEHNMEIKATVPGDKLLIFSVQAGWEPICKFLGKPIPSQPFPNSNEREAIKGFIKSLEEEPGNDKDFEDLVARV